MTDRREQSQLCQARRNLGAALQALGDFEFQRNSTSVAGDRIRLAPSGTDRAVESPKFCSTGWALLTRICWRGGLLLLFLFGALLENLLAANSSLDWTQVQRAPLLLHDWAWRQRLEAQGFRWNAYHLTYLGGLWDGGVGDSGTRLSSSLDLILRFDGEAMMGWEGFDMLSHLKSTYEDNINPMVGARSQVIDDADFTEWFWVDQLWVRQYFRERTWAIQAGYLDQQTILDRNAFANQEDRFFMAQYLDNNNAIIPLRVGLGANIRWYPTPTWDWSLGIADADNRILHVGLDTFFDDAESLVTYSQLGKAFRLGGLPGNLRIGGYYDARDRRINASSDFQSGHFGVFLSADQWLYRESGQPSQGLGLFVRYGYHDASVNAFAHFWSLGVQYEGLIPKRDRDRFGSAVYQVRPAASFRRERGSDVVAETGFETYYLFRMTPWATLSPNIQIIQNPGGSRSGETAIATNLRLRISF